jgi:Tol biopolymer transport system component
LKPEKYLFLIPVFFLTLQWLYADNAEDWKQASTEHFVFIYRQADTPAVRELATFCEDVYRTVTAYFDSYPERVICVVYGNTDLANGYYGFPPHHLGLYVAAPTSPWLGTRYANWLKILLTHELTHYVHLRAEKGLFKALSYVFGDGVKGADAFFLPGWMIEGITTNTETMFTAGGRGRNPFFEMYYKAPLLEGHFFTLDQAEYSSAFPPPGRIYVAGYIFVHFLMERYGEDVFRRINDEYAKWPLFGPWRAIKEVTGHEATELFARMQQELTEKYAPDKLLPAGEPVTPGRFGDYTLPLITARGWVLYRRDLDNHSALVFYDPRTQAEKVLVNAQLIDDYSFTADARGERIVYAGIETRPFFRRIDSTAVSDLYLYTTTDKRLTRLTENAHLYHPALSADGSKLVAVQRRGSYSRLVRVDPATGRCFLLFCEPGSSVYNPVFSPDGQQLAFVLKRGGIQDIYLLPYAPQQTPLAPDDGYEMTAYNTEKKRVIMGPDEAGEYYPRFADDNTLLFSSDRDGSLALYSCSLSTHELFLVCRDPVGAFAGQTLDSDMLYASYSWHGFSVKRMPKEKLLRQPVVLPRPQGFTPVPEESNVRGEPYLDLPVFQFWVPFPNIAFLDDNTLLWGAGAYILGVSPLQTTSYSAVLSFYPTVMQPQGTLALQTALGLADIHYYLDLYYDYSASGYYHQAVSNTLLVSLPVLSDAVDDVGGSISVSAGVQYGYNLYAPQSFPFLNGLDANGTEQKNELNLLSGVSLFWGRHGGVIDFYDPLALAADALLQVPLPVFPESAEGFHSVIKFELNLPFFVPHLVLKLGGKASYTTEELLGYPVIRPRGWFDVQPQAAVGRALASADLLFPLALLDRPLGGGVHLNGMGAGFHAEALADFDPERGSFNADRYVYVGCELTLTIGLGMVTLPMGAGVSARLDTIRIQSFDPARDIRPYLFLGFDSFISSMALRSR